MEKESIESSFFFGVIAIYMFHVYLFLPFACENNYKKLWINLIQFSYATIYIGPQNLINLKVSLLQLANLLKSISSRYR